MGRVFVQGHPQCLKKLTIVGFPSCAGIASLGVEGAFCPTEGGSAVLMLGGDIQDQNSVCQVIVNCCPNNIVSKDKATTQVIPQ